MDFQAFTNDSLTMMYAAVRGVLAADDAAKRQGGEPTFKVRDTPEWKKHAADLQRTWNPKCLDGACCSRSSIGLRDKDPCRFRVFEPRASVPRSRRTSTARRIGTAPPFVFSGLSRYGLAHDRIDFG